MVIAQSRKVGSLCITTLLSLSFLSVNAWAQTTKKATPAPKAAPAKPAAGAAGGTAAHGATTTTHSTTTTTTSHGATTTTTKATTTSAHGTTTTASRTTTTAGHAGGAGPAARGGVAGVHSGNLSHAGPAGSHDRVAANGSAMRTRANGHPMDVHDARRGMDIHHNLAGGRRVDMERADHSHLYYERGRPGYISHPYMHGGHEYYRRSYYYNGRAYDRYYNYYGYRGAYLNVYAPGYYYGAGFYGWAYNPWVAPVPYAWGFAAAPWYGYYGAYFTPYPLYAAPSLWLTDYLISQSLAAAYAAHVAAESQAEAVAASAPPAPLSPETKQMVADEVKRQIALENVESQASAQHQEIDPQSSSIARILSDGKDHVFVAGKEFDLTNAANGQECAVTDGDVLQLAGPPAADATTANLVVMASKGGLECAKQTTVAVSFDDLQEMQNHMRETVDQGLKELQAKQGQGGLPAAPQSATVPPVTAEIAQNAPPPDPAGAQELAQQAKEADKSEQEVAAATAGPGASETPSAGGPSDVASVAAPAEQAQPTSISIGQSTDEVKTAMGQPTRILNLGPKTVYVYKDMKITFKAGKVADVE